MKFIVGILTFLSLLLAENVSPNTLSLLQSIEAYAVRIGEGKHHHYVFVDPLCTKSQAYITLIHEKKRLHENNSYFIFLYRLPKFDSAQHIAYIYQSPSPKEALKQIMIETEPLFLDDFHTTQNTQKLIQKINTVAESFAMKRRPYILSFEEGSHFCTVSDGNAPCQQE